VVPSSHARTGFGAQKKYWLSQSPRENLNFSHLWGYVNRTATKLLGLRYLPYCTEYCNRQGATRFREEVLLYLTTVVPPYILQKESHQLPRQVIQFKLKLCSICLESVKNSLRSGSWLVVTGEPLAAVIEIQCLHICFLMISCGAA